MFSLSAIDKQKAQTSASYENPATLVLNVIGSTAVLTYLIWASEDLTPDFFHFVTCLSDTQGHTLWVFALWTCFKLGFTSSEGLRRVNQNTVFAFVELIIALLLTK